MPKTLKTIKTRVLRRMRQPTLDSIVKMVSKKKPSLWGTKKSRDHLKNSILVAIYKDQYGVSYDSLKEDCSTLLPNTSKKTFRHNQQTLRPLFGKWGK